MHGQLGLDPFVKTFVGFELPIILTIPSVRPGEIGTQRLAFAGQVGFSTETNSGVEALYLSGSVEMSSWWRGAFGNHYLNVHDVELGVDIDPAGCSTCKIPHPRRRRRRPFPVSYSWPILRVVILCR